MTPERYRRLGELFDQVELLAPDARAAFLQELAAADPSLSAELESLLAHDHEARREQLLHEPCPVNAKALLSMDETTCAPVPPFVGAADDALVGRRIGPYLILQRVGRGGMGSVYRALREDAYRQQVAVKVVSPGLDSAEILQRFQTERQVLADLQHPHIARLLDGGATDDGRPYFVMEYIDGEPLDRYCDRHELPTRDRVELLRAVCDAVQWAHEQHVIHRDLKPGNVLVTPAIREGPAAGDRPALGVPKVTDFGLAKRMQEGARLTHTGEILGTPAYMAPEQAGGLVKHLGPATDVYALGAILYELLTGRPPFRGDTPLETLLQVLHEEPVPPGRLHPGLPCELETICLKCLQKEAPQRYASAAALAQDLGRFLRGEPIKARPTPWWERARKWARRQPAVAALSAVLVLGGLLALGLLTWLWQRAESAHADAQERAHGEERERVKAQTSAHKEKAAREQAETHLYYRNIVQADQRWRTGDVAGAETLLEQCAPRLRSGWEWRFLWRRCQEAASRASASVEGRLTAVAFTPDGKRLAFATSGGTVGIQDRRTGAGVRTLAHAGLVDSRLAYSGDGKWLAAASFWEGLTPPLKGGGVIVWDGDGAAPRYTLDGYTCAVFSPDSLLLASGAPDKGVALWDLATGQRLHLLAGHSELVSCVAFSPRGDCLASADRAGAIKLWDPRTGKPFVNPTTRQPVGDLRGHEGSIHSLCFIPDGLALFSAGSDQSVRAWSIPEGKEVLRLSGHQGQVRTVAVHPSKPWVASAGFDRTVRLWDWRTGQALRVLVGHRGTVEGLAFGPDGRELASAGFDGTLRLWEMEGLPGAVALANSQTDSGKPMQALAFSHDGRHVAAGDDAGAVWLWDLGTRQKRPLSAHTQSLMQLAFTAEDDRLVGVDVEGTVVAWDCASAEVHTRDRPPGNHSVFGYVPAAASADGCFCALASADGKVIVWDVAKRAPAYSLKADFRQITCVAFSEDGRHLAAGGAVTGGRKMAIRIWEARPEAAPVAVAEGLKYPFLSMAFSPDTTRLAAGDFQGGLRLWDAQPPGRRKTAGDRLLLSLAGHTNNVWGVAFSPDGERLCSAGADGTLRLWEPGTGEQLLEIPAHQGTAYRVVFSPQGRFLGSCGRDGFVRVWDARSVP
jgi:WD40 repeat protein